MATRAHEKVASKRNRARSEGDRQLINETSGVVQGPASCHCSHRLSSRGAGKRCS